MTKGDAVILTNDEIYKILPSLVRLPTDPAYSFPKLANTIPERFAVSAHSISPKPEYADLWIKKYGRWQHGNGNSRQHNSLGMSYAWWTLEVLGCFEEIHLSDQPDFSATPAWDESAPSVQGDIGRVGFTTFCLWAMRSRKSALWISVLSYDQEFIFESDGTWIDAIDADQEKVFA